MRACMHAACPCQTASARCASPKRAAPLPAAAPPSLLTADAQAAARLGLRGAPVVCDLLAALPLLLLGGAALPACRQVGRQRGRKTGRAGTGGGAQRWQANAAGTFSAIHDAIKGRQGHTAGAPAAPQPSTCRSAPLITAVSTIEAHQRGTGRRSETLSAAPLPPLPHPCPPQSPLAPHLALPSYISSPPSKSYSASTSSSASLNLFKVAGQAGDGGGVCCVVVRKRHVRVHVPAAVHARTVLLVRTVHGAWWERLVGWCTCKQALLGRGKQRPLPHGMASSQARLGCIKSGLPLRLTCPRQQHAMRACRVLRAAGLLLTCASAQCSWPRRGPCPCRRRRTWCA